MEVTPAGNSQVQKEHSATSESKEMEVSKDLGHTKILEKASSFQSDERSKVVEESTSQSMESSHTMSQSVSSSVTSEQKITKASFSSSSSFEATEANRLDKIPEVSIANTIPSTELDPGPIWSPPSLSRPTDFQTATEPTKAKCSPTQSSEIEEGKVKNTLKEIISEIDHYVEKDDNLKETKTKETVTSVESGPGYENISKFSSTDYASEALKPELRKHQDMLMARLPSCLVSTIKGDRPPNLSPETVSQMINSIQIAQELNQVLKPIESEYKDVS